MNITRHCLLCVTICFTGCASPYLADRGRDAADVFTLSAGPGAGIKARVGPVATGLFGGWDSYGLRGGRILDGPYPTGCESVPYMMNSLDLTLLLTDLSDLHDPDLRSRRKEYSSDTVCLYPVNRDQRSAPLHYYTQLEVALGIGLTVRLGINLGELVDFIVGWTSYDILKDDLGSRTTESNRSLQGSSRPQRVLAP